MKIGVIGCGNISGIYLRNRLIFPWVEITKCADLRPEAAASAAEQHGIQAVSVDELLNDPEIELVLNLTIPKAHKEIDLRALEAGKHVYSEKPFALNREDGLEVLALAAKKGLRTGCAPDTFLGAGHQQCRQLIDSGKVGKIMGGTAFMICSGHESWHPSPAFYYEKGGGPLFDMGPYYITALVNMLGPVKRVMAINGRSTDLRIGVGRNEGKTFPVEVDTHITALLEFVNGAAISLVMSFDTWWATEQLCNMIELWGPKASLRTPDPNTFGGAAKLSSFASNCGMIEQENPFQYQENSRIIGLADMAQGILNNRPHRCCGELAYHVLDVMCSIIEAGEKGLPVTLASTCERPAPLRPDLKSGEIN